MADKYPLMFARRRYAVWRARPAEWCWMVKDGPNGIALTELTARIAAKLAILQAIGETTCPNIAASGKST